MGSSYFGVPSMRNHERSSTSSSSLSSSSRKGKKIGSEKPKQPQRGLGVAQLEQIRLRTQMGCGFPPPSLVQEDLRLQGAPYAGTQPSTSSPYAHHPPNFMMVYGDHQRANVTYQDSETSTATRWNPNGSMDIQDRSNYGQPGELTSSRNHFNHFEDASKTNFDLLTSMGASCQNSDSDDHEEVDLELRLSI